ncbi:hypothetical protein EfmAA290_14330 [Enterococcus faecium]|nr:hypothetical protein EfmAA290_14330 [Enterococcus faecium]
MEINADGIGRDASALIDKIRAAQYVRTHPGEVCPAKWKESGETLKPSFICYDTKKLHKQISLF